jgi:hypothetical protein
MGAALACSTVQGFKNRFGSLIGVRLPSTIPFGELESFQ